MPTIVIKSNHTLMVQFHIVHFVFLSPYPSLIFLVIECSFPIFSKYTLIHKTIHLSASQLFSSVIKGWLKAYYWSVKIGWWSIIAHYFWRIANLENVNKPIQVWSCIIMRGMFSLTNPSVEQTLEHLETSSENSYAKKSYNMYVLTSQWKKKFCHDIVQLLIMLLLYIRGRDIKASWSKQTTWKIYGLFLCFLVPTRHRQEIDSESHYVINV